VRKLGNALLHGGGEFQRFHIHWRRRVSGHTTQQGKPVSLPSFFNTVLFFLSLSLIFYYSLVLFTRKTKPAISEPENRRL